jgi:hypothetical protein
LVCPCSAGEGISVRYLKVYQKFMWIGRGKLFHSASSDKLLRIFSIQMPEPFAISAAVVSGLATAFAAASASGLANKFAEKLGYLTGYSLQRVLDKNAPIPEQIIVSNPGEFTPGEFTKIFQLPVPSDIPETPPASHEVKPSDRHEPREYTKIFQATAANPHEPTVEGKLPKNARIETTKRQVRSRLNDARTERDRLKKWSTVNRVSSNSLIFGQYVIGGVMATSFIQKSLSPEIIGIFGVIVFTSSVIKQHYRPEVIAETSSRKASQLDALIRQSEDQLVIIQSKQQIDNDDPTIMNELLERVSGEYSKITYGDPMPRVARSRSANK